MPILDMTGSLRGAISAVNTPADRTLDMIESVVHDFFMAITNLESRRIIRKMGAYDYLTGLKNRNGVFDVEQLVADAEAIMYASKRKYYTQSGGSSERSGRSGPA